MPNDVQHFETYPIKKTAEYVFRPFPRWVTPEGKKAVIVNDPEEYLAVMGTAYSDEGPQEPSPNSSQPSEPDERAQLIAYCVNTGIAIDKRWGVEKIKRAIEDHKSK